MVDTRYNLASIDPNTISFDKENPRGESKEDIESDPEFHKLVESVKEEGILVPLIVYETPSKEKKFKLIDGERRLRASIKANITLVPVHIVDSEESGRILAYHIHKLRKDWNKRNEFVAIKKIKDDLLEKEPSLDDKELFRKILEITQQKDHELKDIMILLKYDESTMDKVQAGELAMSYLIQIDASFITPLKKEFPSIYGLFKEDKLRKILVKKAEEGKLVNTRYLMDNVLKHFSDSTNKKTFGNLLKKFLKESAMDIVKVITKVETKKEQKKSVSVKKNHKKKCSSNTAKPAVVPQSTDTTIPLVSYEKSIIENGVFDLIFNYLKESIIEFEKRTSSKFDSEKKLQNFVYSVLRSLFSSIEFEDPTEKMLETSNKIDFVIKDHSILIEIKYVRDKNHAKRIYAELAEDYHKYIQSPYGKTIINYIYDPDKHLTNHDQFRRQLDKAFDRSRNYIQ